MKRLRRLERATLRRETAVEEWRTAIRDAVASGSSLREVAKAAGVSHVRVLQITRGE